MAVVQETETVVVERVINASPETLWGFWTESEKISSWLSQSAELDPTPGGVAKLIMGGDSHKDGAVITAGEYLVLDPHTHLEFTWGFDDPAIGVPPGSSTVAVDLIPADEGTLVRVTHTGLAAGRDTSPYSERKGWKTMLEHLEEAAA